jgi:hypothetical protein
MVLLPRIYSERTERSWGDMTRLTPAVTKTDIALPIKKAKPILENGNRFNFGIPTHIVTDIAIAAKTINNTKYHRQKHKQHTELSHNITP